jgi:hypothetical protein
LNPIIEIDEVRVDVVQHGTFRQETEGNGHSAAKWLHESSRGVFEPQRPEVRQLPPFATGPLKRWRKIKSVGWGGT